MNNSRYSFIKVLKSDELKKQYYSTIIYPEIEQKQNDTYILTRQFDRLDVLSNKYYGEPDLYWIISLANNISKDSLFIKPGTKLCIPNKNRLSEIYIQIKNLNE